MKKDSLSTLSSESTLQKIQPAPLPAAASPGGSGKSKPSRLKPRNGFSPANGTTAEARKAGNGEPEQAIDTNRVLSAQEGRIQERLSVGHVTEAEAKVALLNQQLEQRLNALTAINSELEAFNYSIAHDLRTPLRSMSGFAKALLEDESANLTPLGLEYATRIARSANYMDNLLLDMLAYSRLSGAEMAPEVFSLEEPVAELLCLVEKEVRDRNITVQVNSPLGAVFAHLPTFKQIVTNLLSNSIKFLAPDRLPQVKIFTTRLPGFVRLWIQDNGIGIAPEHHEKIFGLFQRLHDNQTYPGTGIGLALVRKGAERMGGRVGVESEPAQGSRFWVDLPAVPTLPDGH